MIDSVIIRWLVLSFLPLILFITQNPSPGSPRVILSPTIISVLGWDVCQGLDREIETVGEESCGSLYIPMVPMGGKIESQREMYALRRTQKDSQNHRHLNCAFYRVQTNSNFKICMGREMGMIIVTVMKTIIATDSMEWKGPSREQN